MSQKITVITAQQENCMCPTVICGKTDDGCTVYARYRFGRLVIRLDYRDPPPHGGAAGMWLIDQQIDPDGIAGAMSYDELREITAEVIDWPEQLNPPSYGDGDSWLTL